MTSLQRSIFVIPSTALEELPKRMGHPLALDFLTAWTSQWDPRLLVGLGNVPEWKKIDGNSLDLEHALILCPEASRKKLDQPQRERLQLGECLVIDSESHSRPELVARILSGLNLESDVSGGKPLLCDDFYALGYAVLQIQILARKLRYSWNIDWIAFTEQALSAAKASMAGDETETERWLQACFDSLSQERDRYCSQQAYLLEVILLAPSTLQSALDQQLQSTHPTNLLACASLLQEIQDRNPAAWEVIRAKMSAKNLAVIGGLESDQMLVRGSVKAQWRQMRRGQKAYNALGMDVPGVFSRFGPGFSANAPNWLSKFGFRNVMLHAWSEGVVPDGDQAKIKWQSSHEGSSVDALVSHVLDASSADSYLDLALSLAGQLDYHQVPTLILAHWPELPSQPQKDLLRLIARSPALGAFQTVDHYFATTSQPYSSTTFPSNAFKIAVHGATNQQAMQHHRMMQYEQLRVRTERMQSLSYLWDQIAAQTATHDSLESKQGFADKTNAILEELDAGLESEIQVGIEARIAQQREYLLKQIQATLSKGPRSTGRPDLPESGRGYLLINPGNHPMRLFLEGLEGEVDPSSSKRIVACDARAGRTDAVVDIPPFGFVRMRLNAASGSRSASSSSSDKPSKSTWLTRLAGIRSGIVGTDWTLANEYMELQIDPKRGHLRSMYIANKRGSRLSGMPSLVEGGSDAKRKWNDTDCLTLSNIQLRIVRDTPLVGSIEMTGEAKLSTGQTVVLKTRYTLWKGARSVEVVVESENLDSQSVSCVWRTAWLNEGATLAAWQHGAKGKLQGPLQATVELIEIDDAEHRIYIASKGLSFHRRSDSRFLISDVPIGPDGNVKGHFSIGIDWPRPYESAMDFCDVPWIVEDSAMGSSAVDEGAWLAQCSLPSVHMSFVDPAPAIDASECQEQKASLLAGKVGDACILLCETQAKSGSARLSFFRDVAEAWRVDSQGREFESLTVIDGQISIHVKSNEQSRILMRWKQS